MRGRLGNRKKEERLGRRRGTQKNTGVKGLRKCESSNVRMFEGAKVKR